MDMLQAATSAKTSICPDFNLLDTQLGAEDFIFKNEAPAFENEGKERKETKTEVPFEQRSRKSRRIIPMENSGLSTIGWLPSLLLSHKHVSAGHPNRDGFNSGISCSCG